MTDIPTFHVDSEGTTIYSGSEVTSVDGSRRGVVTDGYRKKSGPYQRLIAVMWIGGRYPVYQKPSEIIVLNN